MTDFNEATGSNVPETPDEPLTEEHAPADNTAEELKTELGALRTELEKLRAELEATGRAAAVRHTDSVPATAGKVGGGSATLFSPAEVRAMSRSEVRDNLDRIRESMRHW